MKLRQRYTFCIFCGLKDEDKDDYNEEASKHADVHMHKNRFLP